MNKTRITKKKAQALLEKIKEANDIFEGTQLLEIIGAGDDPTSIEPTYIYELDKRELNNFLAMLEKAKTQTKALLKRKSK